MIELKKIGKGRRRLEEERGECCGCGETKPTHVITLGAKAAFGHVDVKQFVRLCPGCLRSLRLVLERERQFASHFPEDRAERTFT